MLKELMSKLGGVVTSESFDPSVFNDPLANEIAWGPVKRGGASFCSHRLKMDQGSTCATFKMTAGAYLFGLIFAVMGIGVPSGIAFGMWQDTGVSIKLLFPLAFGLIFTSVGLGMIFWMRRPIVFDRVAGYYWKGGKAPDAMSVDDRERKNCEQLYQIHALQIISEYCHSDKSSYYSYELNLVLRDGSRLNVVDHGSLRKLQEDAQQLSQFLGVPLWDASMHR